MPRFKTSRRRKRNKTVDMCVPLFAIWAGRHNNGPIEERHGEVRGGNVNTRVVKLQPLNKDSHKNKFKEIKKIPREKKEEGMDQRYEMFPVPFGVWDVRGPFCGGEE
jgi:hypothetical protein